MLRSLLLQSLLSLSVLTAVVPLRAETRVAPDCRLAPLQGGSAMPLSDYRGKVVYLDFWASWCGPCVESFPYMNKLSSELTQKGLQVVAVNLDEDPADGKAFVAEHPVAFAVAGEGGQHCAQQFQLKGMPTSYLIDKQGNIRETHVGFRPGEAEAFRTSVEALLAETP